MPANDWVSPALRQLQEELRTLERRARERRREAGKPDSRREAVKIANRDYHGGGLNGQRISE